MPARRRTRDRRRAQPLKFNGALLAFLLSWPVFGADSFRAGAARADITPEGSIWLSGYAARTHPSTGVESRLYAKALAIQDGARHSLVIVTTDLIGLPRVITDAVAARLAKERGLSRQDVVFNSSHTHTGPVVRANLQTMYDLPASEWKTIEAYSLALTEKLFTVSAAALDDLAPASVAAGFGEAPFAINRRKPGPNGFVIDTNPAGPVDHTVPVLRITGPDSKLRAVLFGYACHNTTLTGEFYEVTGDYAGFAQAAIEASHPGATALFFQLCAGDQNPQPRSALELARRHGATLAASVEKVLSAPMQDLSGRLRTAYTITELNFAPHTRETFEQQLSDKSVFVVRRAREMLKHYDEGHPVRRTPYPVQAMRLGNGPVLLALGGEVVIDYNLRAKREYPSTKMIVAGYSNDVMCYIPSKRVLKEGGYEGADSMIYYGMPGPFADDVEDRVFDAVHGVMRRVGLKEK